MNQQLTHGTRSVPPKNRRKTMLEQFENDYPNAESFAEHVRETQSLNSIANIIEDVYTLVLDTVALIEDKKDDPEVKKIIGDVEQLLADL